MTGAAKLDQQYTRLGGGRRTVGLLFDKIFTQKYLIIIIVPDPAASSLTHTWWMEETFVQRLSSSKAAFNQFKIDENYHPDYSKLLFSVNNVV